MNSIDLDKLEHKELLLDNGNTFYYVVKNGTCYQYAIKLKDGTYEERDKSEMADIIWACEYARNYKERVRIWYGDPDGRSWNEEYDIIGYLSRTTGPYSIPILLFSERSHGGMGVLVQRIIRVDSVSSKRTLYKHKNFYVEPMEIHEETEPELLEKGCSIGVYQGIRCAARFKTKKQAVNWIKFMTGERYCK